ncbi:hypothetical protein C4568_01265 [Candidatus Parcubacteria bacterium]|nr:MAG: hypothetical protein C4568_01265 [Candidatus Parcubacteria bacterium]
MQRIHEYSGKIKGVLDQGLSEWGIFAIVVLVGLISFGLGRLSALEEARPPVSVSMAAAVAAPAPVAPGGLVVASRGGSSYYYPWCGGAQNIAEGNKVWFDSEKEAEAAGYVPAKNCKGLEK